MQEGVRRFSFRGKEAPRPLVGPAGALSRTPDDDVIIKVRATALYYFGNYVQPRL